MDPNSIDYVEFGTGFVPKRHPSTKLPAKFLVTLSVMIQGRIHFSLLMLAIFWLGSFTKAETPRKVKGLRLDAGYLYDTLYSNQGASTVDSLSRLVVDKAVTAGFNTIFFLAYVPDSGAMYPTQYPYTTVEGDFGQNDFLGALIENAHSRNLKVVAWLPVNSFAGVWRAKPEWRSKQKSKKKNSWWPFGNKKSSSSLADYKPTSDSFFLSAWNKGYRNWYQGFLEDLCNRYPGLDGLEAGEGLVDYNWDGKPDYNADATSKYRELYPQGILGDENWKRVRAQGMTDLHRLVGLVAQKYQKESHVVQTWSAAADGSLMPSVEIMMGSGFDFEAILNLSSRDGKPDYFTGEFMWQQWKETYGSSVFNPEWTRKAAERFINIVGSRSTPIVHVEYSPFGGVSQNNSSFKSSLKNASFGGLVGIDVYDFHQLETNRLLNSQLVP